MRGHDQIGTQGLGSDIIDVADNAMRRKWLKLIGGSAHVSLQDAKRRVAFARNRHGGMVGCGGGSNIYLSFGGSSGQRRISAMPAPVMMVPLPPHEITPRYERLCGFSSVHPRPIISIIHVRFAPKADIRRTSGLEACGIPSLVSRARASAVLQGRSLWAGEIGNCFHHVADHRRQIAELSLSVGRGDRPDWAANCGGRISGVQGLFSSEGKWDAPGNSAISERSRGLLKERLRPLISPIIISPLKLAMARLLALAWLSALRNSASDAGLKTTPWPDDGVEVAPVINFSGVVLLGIISMTIYVWEISASC